MKVPFKTFNPPVMNHPNFARIVSILILIGFSGAFAQAKSNRVAVRAEATKDYTLLRERDKSAKVQTYHLAKGLFLGGNVVDGSLDESSFEEIADELGHNLRRQNYFSESDPNSGDLLIMVHYGASNFIGDEEDAEIFDINDYLPKKRKANGDVYEYTLTKNAIPKVRGLTLPSSRKHFEEGYFRSRLLGMDDIYRMKVTDYEAYVQRELAAEGRYFIVLTAFDLPLLRSSGEKKVLWSMRYSIRTIGQPFGEALRELNFVAGHYFGKNMKGLISKRADDKSLVELGEIEVIGN